MAKPKSGGTPATVALTRAGVRFVLHPYEHHEGERHVLRRRRGDEAAAAIGVDPRRIFKTVLVDLGGELVVAVVPVSDQLDLKALGLQVEVAPADLLAVTDALSAVVVARAG